MINHFNLKKLNYNNMIFITLIFLIIFISLFSYKYVYDFIVNQESCLKLFVLIALFLWVLKIINNDEKLYLLKTKLNSFIYIFIFLMGFSVITSKTKMLSFKDYLIFFSYFMLFFIIKNNINSEKYFYYFIKVFFVTSFIISMYTLFQYYGIDPYLNELNSLTSTIGQENWISNYLAMIFPIVFSCFLLEKIKKNKMIYYFLLSIIYTTLVVCQSRGIWISISLTLIFAIFIIFKFNLLKTFKENKKWLILLILTFIIISTIYSTDNPLNKSAITVTERAISTFDEQDPSINTRILIWKTTLEMIKDRPLLGTGIGTFKLNYFDYQAEFLKDNPEYTKYWTHAREAHNEYLQMAAEIGIVGLGIFLLIIIIFYNLTMHYLKKESNDKRKIIVFGMLLGITCFLIHSFFCFPLHVPALGSTFFIIFSIIVVYIKDFDLPRLKKERNIINNGLKIVLNILILFLMIVIVNYLVIKPYIAEIYYFEGTRNNVNDNYIVALINLEKAVKLDAYNGRILHALGTTYYNLGVFDKAKEVLGRTKKYIIDLNNFYNLGLVYYQMGSYKEAEKEFKKVVYLDPKYFKAYHNLGLLYFIQKDYDGAIDQWNKILEIEPNFPNKYIVLNNLGIVYQKKEMPDRALEYFVQVLQLVPEGSPIEKEIEEEVNKIYKSKLSN